MGHSRAGRSRLILIIGLLLCVAAGAGFLHREDRTSEPDRAGLAAWPADVGQACARDARRTDGQPRERAFYRAHPVWLAAARTTHFAVVLQRSKDATRWSSCHATRGSAVDFTESVHALRPLPAGVRLHPWTVLSLTDGRLDVSAVALVNRLPQGATRAVMWLADGRKVRIPAARDGWVAWVTELSGPATAHEVRRFRYLAGDRVLAEYVAPGVRPTRGVAPLASYPALDSR